MVRVIRCVCTLHIACWCCRCEGAGDEDREPDGREARRAHRLGQRLRHRAQLGITPISSTPDRSPPNGSDWRAADERIQGVAGNGCGPRQRAGGLAGRGWRRGAARGRGRRRRRQ
jgi:hypothetical protein